MWSCPTHISIIELSNSNQHPWNLCEHCQKSSLYGYESSSCVMCMKTQGSRLYGVVTKLSDRFQAVIHNELKCEIWFTYCFEWNCTFRYRILAYHWTSWASNMLIYVQYSQFVFTCLFKYKYFYYRAEQKSLRRANFVIGVIATLIFLLCVAMVAVTLYFTPVMNQFASKSFVNC